MNSLSELLAYDGYVIPIVLAIVLVIALGVVMGITTRLRRLEKRYQRLLGAESHGMPRNCYSTSWAESSVSHPPSTPPRGD